jgi:hypothetical protein
MQAEAVLHLYHRRPISLRPNCGTGTDGESRMVMYRGRGRRYGYGRPGRRVRGYYRARSRTPGPVPGCLLPLALFVAVGIRLARRSRGP